MEPVPFGPLASADIIWRKMVGQFAAEVGQRTSCVVHSVTVATLFAVPVWGITEARGDHGWELRHLDVGVRAGFWQRAAGSRGCGLQVSSGKGAQGTFCAKAPM